MARPQTVVRRQAETTRRAQVSLWPEDIEALLSVPTGCRVYAIGVDPITQRVVIGLEGDGLPECPPMCEPEHYGSVFVYSDPLTGQRWLALSDTTEEQKAEWNARVRIWDELVSAVDDVLTTHPNAFETLRAAREALG